MLANPVKDFICKAYPSGDITQFFGENPALYANTCAAPGMCLHGHNGLDIVRAWGEPIYSVSDGKVVEIKEDTTGYGKHVRILGEGFEWVYGHQSKILCQLGQQIKRGDLIGNVGNTGFVVSGSTPYWKYNPFAGSHLHLGRRPVLPAGSTWNVSYATGDKGTIPDYPGDYLGSVPLIPEDFATGIQAPQDNSLTIQSLQNLVEQLKTEGKTAQASMVQAIIGFIKAFSA